MQEQRNVDLIKRLYEAFGKGDIDAIFEHFADHFFGASMLPRLFRLPEIFKPKKKFAAGISDL
jgi:hypothetical protein